MNLDHYITKSLEIKKIIQEDNFFSEWDCILSIGENSKMQANEGIIDSYSQSKTHTLGLRGIKDNRVALSYTEDLSPESIRAMINQAKKIQPFSAKNPHETLPEKTQESLEVESHLLPKDPYTVEEKKQLTLELEKQLRFASPHVRAIPYCNLTSATSGSILLNSKGSHILHAHRYFSGLGGVVLASDGHQSSAYNYFVDRKAENFHPKNLATEVVEQAELLLKGKPIPKGTYDIIFSHDEFESLFSAFSGIFSAMGAMRKVNPFSEKKNEKIASEKLTLIDDPLDSQGLHYSRYDSEGTPTKAIPLIEDGVLKTFIHNQTTANFFSTSLTGHASRGPRSTSGVSLHQTKIAAGQLSEHDLKQDNFFEVLRMDGLHSGTNSVSGEFSVAAFGRYWKDGKPLHSVKGVTLSGNFFTMLNSIQGLANEVHWNKGRSFAAPLIRFQGLSVAS